MQNMEGSGISAGKQEPLQRYWRNRRRILRDLFTGITVFILTSSSRFGILGETFETQDRDLPRKRVKIIWTEAMDAELFRRWYAYQPRKIIAFEMGVTEGVIRGRAVRLGLRSRPRHLIRQT